jgi:hypothetical protein
MRAIKQNSIYYAFSLWLSIIAAYAITGNLRILFHNSSIAGLLIATAYIVVFTILLYMITFHLPAKMRLLIAVLWFLIPLIAIALYMQIGFQAFFGHWHGFGYVRGLGDAKKVWLLFSGISLFWSTITYFLATRKRGTID